MRTIPLSIQTVYADLVQQAHAAGRSEGSVYAQTVRGHEYLYARRSVGNVRRDVFLGRADDEEVREKAVAAKMEMARIVERRTVVSSLRSFGLPAPTGELGAVLDVLADAGLFETAVLVGTAAYQCYAPIVGAMLPSAAMMTQDADIATASLTLAAASEDETLETILRRADKTFRGLPALDRKALPSRFRSASGFLVDVLTPKLRRSDKSPMPLKRIGAGAVPLQHLGWLIEEPVQAVALHGPGIPVRLPSPARYGVHKLLVAQKRAAENVKRRKDLAQAKSLMEALSTSDPWAWEDAIDSACAQGKTGWETPIRRSLREIAAGGEP